MKKIILLLFITQSLLSCAQESKTQPEIVRVQGYLFIQTSIKNNTSTNIKETEINIDSPKRYFFIPLKDLKYDLKESIKLFKNPIKDELYLPLSLTESERNIKSTNANLDFYIKENTIDILPITESKKFSKKTKTTFKIENDIVVKRVYEIVYIDGLWEKLKVPFKWSEVISIGNYSSSSLNRKNKNGYDYYFLKEIKLIAYDLKLNESGLVKLNNFIKNDLIHETTHN